MPYPLIVGATPVTVSRSPLVHHMERVALEVVAVVEPGAGEVKEAQTGAAGEGRWERQRPKEPPALAESRSEKDNWLRREGHEAQRLVVENRGWFPPARGSCGRMRWRRS